MVDIIASMHSMQIIGHTMPLKYYGVSKIRHVIKPLYHRALNSVLSCLLCACQLSKVNELCPSPLSHMISLPLLTQLFVTNSHAYSHTATV